MTSSIPSTSAEIRQSFLDFFKEKEHLFVPSAPVVPHDDPTLMFTNAGMNQFKGIFLGDNPKGWTRAANSQKCIRVSGKHNDLDEVGRDTYHHTLFEMLGNWSFGDYYKKEAIAWAWELLTERWGLAKDRLFITVYEDDDEAAELWHTVAGVEKHRIMRFGAKDNFWEMGDTGPCGPCSEIHYDKGDITTQNDTYADPIKGVNGENDRYIEIWNLVFMQYNRGASGDLAPLANTHVDTGMGFERLCAILQNVHSNYDTDIFAPIIKRIAELSGVSYQQGLEGMPHRVIADHLRAVSFSIADGVMPSNEGRGYVIRRILRRASRYARLLGQTEAFIYKLVELLATQMGAFFPEIEARKEFVAQVIQSEEERFIKTLDKGLERFERIVEETKAANSTQIDGEKVFVLYDTYGFPSDLTRIMAEELSMSIDEEGFEKAMTEQKERARAARKTGVAIADEEGWVKLNDESSTEFLGYDSAEAKVRISRYREEEGKVYFVASSTPFYAESGGQVGEKGLFQNSSLRLKILDTKKINDAWVHIAEVEAGDLTPETASEEFVATTLLEERRATRANHSATHLLHAALREILGEHVNQQGSRVDSQSLRFDFSHFQAMSQSEIDAVENWVNERVRANLPVNTELKGLEEAKEAGAMALFGEKYDSEVRVVSMGGDSVELCGGLHVSATGEIGLISITVETSVAAGVRRIEAVTGVAAQKRVQNQAKLLQQIQGTLKCQDGQVLDRLATLIEKQKELEKESQRLQDQLAQQKVKSLFAEATELKSVAVLIKEFKGMDKKEFGTVVDAFANSFNGVAVLSNIADDAGSIAATVPKALHKSLKAGDLVKEIAALAGGKGGGRPDRAQAGTREIDKIPAAMSAAKGLVEGLLP